MGAQTNIKSDEADALASEIAAMSGTSLTQTVLDALRASKRELTRETKVTAVMERGEALLFQSDGFGHTGVERAL